MRPVNRALLGEGGLGSQPTSIPYLVRKNWSIFAVVTLFSISLLLKTPSGSLRSSGIQGSDVSTESSISKFTADMKDPKVLNVHVVPHTHDDVGWLKTVDQYYFGLNNSIQDASVHDILDSVVASLLDNPSRTFTYVEQKFFSMWWERQNDAVKDAVRFLVGNKQLGFVNGGWCMHDEATTHFMGMIDQTTLGHSFLKKEFGVVPTVGWQLDPFGHSATQASLLTSKAGFDALYFGRIDYQDRELRQFTRGCEGLWNSSKSWEDSTVFWGLTGSFRGMYGAPEGYCFDIHCEDPKLAGMHDTALSKSIENFLRIIRRQSEQTKGNHIMLTMGEDFQYQRARVNFASLDTLIGSIMNFQQWGKIDATKFFGPEFDHVNVFYSSPEYYTKCKYEEMQASSPKENSGESISHTVSVSIKEDDFFPYSDCEHCFWTGYFTSRTGFKRMERVASAFLMAARQIEALQDYNTTTEQTTCEEGIHQLADAAGVAQHHDGVAGTAKQHVANDYAKRLQAGIDASSGCMIQKVRRLLHIPSNSSDFLSDLSYCQLLNETKCEVSQQATKAKGNDLYVIVYNALAFSYSTIIHLPVSSDAPYHISRVGSAGKEDQILLPIRSISKMTSEGGSDYLVLFDTGPLPPLGAAVFRLSRAEGHHSFPLVSSDKSVQSRRLQSSTDPVDEVEVSNGLMTVRFDSSTGSIKQVAMDDTNLDLSQTWGYYESFDSTFDSDHKEQDSGAYIFRPSTPEQKIRALEPSSAKFYNTSLGFEVHVYFKEPWIQTVTRVLTGLPYVEVEYTIGPIPINDGRGKEVVTRFSAPIQSAGTFFTDSNAREFLKRKRNSRPTWDLNVFEPVAGNYYPVNAAIYLEDEENALAVVTDRTQGGTSLVDGTVELMVQRRILADDGRGVSEALNETIDGMTPYPPYGTAQRLGDGIVIKGKHRIMIGGDKGGARLARSMMDAALVDPLVFVGSAPSHQTTPLYLSGFSGLQNALPPNVMLVTLARLHDRSASTKTTTFLVRLGHQYAIGEDEVLSKPVEIDLDKLFNGYKVVAVMEKTLTGNQDYTEWLKRRLDWTGTERVPKGSLIDGTVVHLEPMDIRTFEVTVEDDV